jgi:quinol-cytochrome oxidoreductase complex cytochrome b subunit
MTIPPDPWSVYAALASVAAITTGVQTAVTFTVASKAQDLGEQWLSMTKGNERTALKAPAQSASDATWRLSLLLFFMNGSAVLGWAGTIGEVGDWRAILPFLSVAATAVLTLLWGLRVVATLDRLIAAKSRPKRIRDWATRTTRWRKPSSGAGPL